MKSRPKLLASAGLIALLWLAAPAAAQDAGPWTLPAALDYAQMHNPDLQTAEAQLVEGHEAEGEVFAHFLPNLTALGGYTYISNVPEMEVNMEMQPLPIAPPIAIHKKFPLGAHDNTRLEVDFSQLLFASGQVYYSYRAVSDQLEAGEHRVDAIRLRVSQMTAEAFLGVLMTQSVAQAQREALATSQAHLTQVTHRYDAGAATRFELLRAQVDVANLEPQVTEADKNVETARTGLRRAMGLGSDAPLHVTGDLETTPTPVDENAALERAQQTRPELTAYAVARQAAEHQALAYRGAMLPAVMLNASYSYQRPYYSLDQWESNWTVGVGIRIPIFDGLQNYHSMRRARAMAETATHNQAQVQADIFTEVHTAVLALREADVRMQSTCANLERAKQMVAIAEKSYQAGAVTSLEVIDAQLAATGAHVAYLKALYDYRVARVRLAAATGDQAAIGG
jgi:outer membrane protein TolC